MRTIRKTVPLLVGALLSSPPACALADSLWIASDDLTEMNLETGENMHSYPVDAIAFDVDDTTGTAWYSDGARLTAVRNGQVIAGPVDVKGVASAQVSDIVVDDDRGRVWAVRGNEVSVFDANGVELRWWDLSTPYGNNTHIVTLEVAADTGFAWIAQPGRVLHLRADRPWVYGRLWSNWHRVQDIDVVSNGVWVQRFPPANPYDTRLELHSFKRPADPTDSGIIAEMSAYRTIRFALDPLEICADEAGVWVLGGYYSDVIYGALRTEIDNPYLSAAAAPDTGYEQDFPAVVDAACGNDGNPWLAWNRTVARFGEFQNWEGVVTRRIEIDGVIRSFRIVRD